MSPATVVLLVVAIVMVTIDGGVDSAELVLSGSHVVEEDGDGALMVGEAVVTVPEDATVSGPVYVAGGLLRVEGTVDGDVVQLAGTIEVDGGGMVSGELRHVGGTQVIDPSAVIGRVTRLEVPASEPGIVGRSTRLVVTALVLAGAARMFVRRRERELDNIVDSIARHPVISITVGLLLSLTLVAVVVFMAFTVVLLPVALVAVVAGIATLGVGVIAWGRLAGRLLGLSAPLGVVVVVLVLWAAGMIPVVGDLLVIGVSMAGVGAAVVTYFGLVSFEPALSSDLRRTTE